MEYGFAVTDMTNAEAYIYQLFGIYGCLTETQIQSMVPKNAWLDDSVVDYSIKGLSIKKLIVADTSGYYRVNAKVKLDWDLLDASWAMIKTMKRVQNPNKYFNAIKAEMSKAPIKLIFDCNGCIYYVACVKDGEDAIRVLMLSEHWKDVDGEAPLFQRKFILVMDGQMTREDIPELQHSFITLRLMYPGGDRTSVPRAKKL